MKPKERTKHGYEKKREKEKRERERERVGGKE